MCEGLTFDQYRRLIWMATVEMAATVPISIWIITIKYTPPAYYPWKGFADLHWGFSRVDQIPSISWLADRLTRQGVEESRWISIACAIWYFAIFGTTTEARNRYKAVILKPLELLGVRTKTTDGRR